MTDGSPARPRILYLCFERIAPGRAASTHVGEICAGLRRRGFDVRLVAEHGPRAAGLATQLTRYLTVTLAAAAALPGRDVVYMRAHFAGFGAALLARLARRRVVQEVNGPYEDAFVTHARLRPLRRLLSALQRRQYRWADAVVAVTPGLRDWAVAEAGHERVHLVPNAADTDRFRPDGDAAIRERPYALFFGGLTRWHGVPTMLAALRRPDWPRGLDLVLAGPVVDGAVSADLDPAPPGLHHLGPLPQAELPALIRGASMTLCPISDPGGRSRHGVLPLKLLEGLACGVPAVVTDLPGQRELVRDGECGLTVPVDDAAGLAAAVARLAADPVEARRLGENGARLVRSSYNWDASAERTAVIIASLTASR